MNAVALALVQHALDVRIHVSVGAISDARRSAEHVAATYARLADALNLKGTP